MGFSVVLQDMSHSAIVLTQNIYKFFTDLFLIFLSSLLQGALNDEHHWEIILGHTAFTYCAIWP